MAETSLELQLAWLETQLLHQVFRFCFTIQPVLADIVNHWTNTGRAILFFPWAND